MSADEEKRDKIKSFRVTDKELANLKELKGYANENFGQEFSDTQIINQAIDVLLQMYRFSPDMIVYDLNNRNKGLLEKMKEVHKEVYNTDITTFEAFDIAFNEGLSSIENKLLPYLSSKKGEKKWMKKKYYTVNLKL